MCCCGRAKIEVAVLEKVDVAAGMRTNRVEGLNRVAGPAEINRADGDLSKFVPGIDAIGEDGEFPGDAVVGEGLERSKSNGGNLHLFCAAGGSRNTSNPAITGTMPSTSANDTGKKALEEVARPNRWGRVTRVVHN